VKSNFRSNLLKQLREDIWGWTVFVLTLIAIIPVGTACWINPEENNIAAFSLWIVLGALFVYSLAKQGFSGWRLAFGYLIGNVSLVIIATIRGGYFDLGPTEQIVLFGIIGSVSIWKIRQVRSGKPETRTLYYGLLFADISSFYPMMKQWEGPANASAWMISGWLICLVGVLINLFMVERIATKLLMPPDIYRATYNKEKKVLLIMEESFFSVEQAIFIVGMVSMMAW
jgi:hypothetical protein